MDALRRKEEDLRGFCKTSELIYLQEVFQLFYIHFAAFTLAGFNCLYKKYIINKKLMQATSC